MWVIARAAAGWQTEIHLEGRKEEFSRERSEVVEDA
jgi:hypothetical protein